MKFMPILGQPAPGAAPPPPRVCAYRVHLDRDT